MRGHQLTAIVIAALAGLAMPIRLAAQEETQTADTPAPTAAQEKTKKSDAPTDQSGLAKDAKMPTPPGSRAESPSPNSMPQNAAAALVRAVAAYEYGDMNQVVEASRPVAEGLLPASPEEQAKAFRLLGIGLYLTNRPLGAETAFTELLRKDPKAHLDPTTTRPELVAFFESLRHQQLTRQRSERKLYWNFLPPVGQFQNDDKVKGWVILSVGASSMVASATAWSLKTAWAHKDETSDHPVAANVCWYVNVITGGVLIATYLYGVIDGLIGYSRPLEESKPPVSLQFFPSGGGLGFTF
jgi:hypothetical protein